jgi:hypothetical protein
MDVLISGRTRSYSVRFAGTNGNEHGRLPMPSLIRLLTILAILCALVYAGLYSLAHFVQPHPRSMSVFIPPSRFVKNP